MEAACFSNVNNTAQYQTVPAPKIGNSIKMNHSGS